MLQIRPMQTAEIVLGKKPNVLWIPFSLAILELTNMTMMKAIPICPMMQATTR